MMPLLGAVMLASIAGSTHCLGMCGAFVTLAVAAPDARAASPFALQAAYHGGRLATYTAVGALAGALGTAIDTGAALAGVQNVAITLSASLVALFALSRLAVHAGIRTPRLRMPSAWTRVVETLHRVAWAMRPTPRAAAIGLLTTLLPCGWLYAFVAVALGAGSPARAALVMAAFWVGTVPLLAALGAGVRRFSRVPGLNLPVATTVVLLVASVATLAGRGRLLGMLVPERQDDPLRAAAVCCPDPVNGLAKTP
jgi:hypothetical protein